MTCCAASRVFKTWFHFFSKNSENSLVTRIFYILGPFGNFYTSPAVYCSYGKLQSGMIYHYASCEDKNWTGVYLVDGRRRPHHHILIGEDRRLVRRKGLLRFRCWLLLRLPLDRIYSSDACRQCSADKTLHDAQCSSAFTSLPADWWVVVT